MKNLNTTPLQRHLARLLFLGLVFFAAGGVAHTQTCTGNIFLSNQAQVDAFNCTTVTGNLSISGSNITNLDGLSELTMVGINLYIFSNSSLMNMDGLASVSSVGRDLWIEDNSSLTNIDGLANLSSVVRNWKCNTAWI